MAQADVRRRTATRPSAHVFPFISSIMTTTIQAMNSSLPLILSQSTKISLKSWKGDYLHRPDSPQGVTTWNTGIGNAWTVELIDGNKIRLKSWKGDYLHRPDSTQGVTTWNTGVGNEWTVELIDGNKIRLKSWKGDYLHRPDSTQGVTTWNTGVGNEWIVEPVVATVTFNQSFPANPSISAPYSEAGLTFNNNVGNRWASPFVNNFVGTYGLPSKLTVTPAQGKVFTFKSLQVCNINSAISPQNTVFKGTRSDGTTVSATFTTPANNSAPQTFAPSDFTNLVSLVIDLGFVAFDNFAFVEGVIPPVIIPCVGFGQNFPAGCPSVATPYTEAGLTFTNNCGNRWASPMINNFVATYGSPSKLTVTPAQGKTFSFKSLQVCNANSTIRAQATVFTGTRRDGTTVKDTFSTPANNTAPQTFSPPDFTNLVSLVIDLGFVGFDNLVFIN